MDIERAVESLSQTDERRLERFARYRIRGLGRTAMGRTHEDLQQEAITSTWMGAENDSGGRRWRKDVPFVQHLLGAMRSISSHWNESTRGTEMYLDSELAAETVDGKVFSPMSAAASGEPSQDRVLTAKEELADVFRAFQEDDDAALIIEGMREGWTGQEIMEQLEIPRKKYEAAVKRIRYRLK